MSAALRQEQHLLGRQHLKKGDYFSALAVFQKALVNYGPHVGLLSDIITSFYLLGRVEDCQSATQRLQAELEKSKEFLSASSFVKTSIFLGKMLEEQAEVALALECYEEAALKAPEDTELKIKAQTQLLRLRSFLGIKTDLSELYQLCLKYAAKEEDLDIEMEHGLMLAELSLFGQISAMDRLKSLLAKDLLSADLRLMAMDFAEYLLSMQTHSPQLTEVLKTLPQNDFDEFEKVIFEFYTGGKTQISMAEINRVAKLLPTMGLLKVFILGSFQLENENARLELKKRFIFIVSGLSKRSQALIRQKWCEEAPAEKIILKLSLQNNSLHLNDRSFPIKPDSFGHRCLTSFVGVRSLPIEEFVKKVFESEYNLSYHDRTRIALQRLNKDLSKLTGMTKIFVLQKSVVSLNDAIEIQFL